MKALSKWFNFFTRLFYDPMLYKDVAFREQGYGMKRALVYLLILMLPSYFLLIYQLNHSYQTQWKAQIEKIPYMRLVNGSLLEVNQSFQAKDALKKLDMHWLPVNQPPLLSNQKEFPPYFIGTINLFVKVPKYNLFGMNIIDNHLYLPLSYTSDYHKDFISGFSIIESINLFQIIAFSTITWLMSYFVSVLFLLSFLRSFGFIANKMVSLFMHEKIKYDTACRLLSACGIIPMTIVAMSMDLMPYQDHYKYVFLTIYMFNFYFAIRLISMRSLSRWLSPSA
jgi:hypothetical protein